MWNRLLRLKIALLTFMLASSLAHAEPSDFTTVVGTVKKIERETNTLTIIPIEKWKQPVVLKVTGTSKMNVFAPQTKLGKTVMSSKSAEMAELVAGQSIAVIYTVIDKENIVLAAAIKPFEKDKMAEKEKSSDKVKLSDKKKTK